MLQVAIHGDDVVAAGVVEAGGQGGSLAEVSAQFYHRNPAVHRRDFAQQVKRAVGGTVIHQDQLEALPADLHYCFQTIVEIGDVLLLVVQRNDDGVLGHEAFIILKLLA